MHHRFFSDEHEDDALQFELDVAPEYQQSITDVLGWGALIEHANGELRLTDEQVGKIEAVLNKILPEKLIFLSESRSDASISQLSSMSGLDGQQLVRSVLCRRNDFLRRILSGITTY